MRYEISEVVKKDQVMELVFGNCSKPKDLLGRHFILQGQVISAYHPDAVKMEVISEDGEHYPMDTVDYGRRRKIILKRKLDRSLS